MDADIEQFFDTLDHQQLMTALRRRISDGEVLRLIYRWLKAGYLAETHYPDTDQGSPQGSVLSPLLANVYLYGFDQAQGAQKSFIGRLVRYADDFVIQCGTAAHAERALVWAREQLQTQGLRLHSEKTRVVSDREGFDFLGFHHRRVPLRLQGHKESYGVLRWPSRKAQQRFRERIRQIVGPPGRLRAHWSDCMVSLSRYLSGWGQYYRRGQSAATFTKLDRYVAHRVARNYARSQLTGRGRKRRNWMSHLERLQQWGKLPNLKGSQQGASQVYRGQAKVRWRAV